MHSTRRRFDRRAWRLLFATALASGAAAASCSSSDDASSGPRDSIDAAADAALDASESDADRDARVEDAGIVDVEALPVTCTTAPCARALVTTLGHDADESSEGFCALLDDGTVACWGANGAGQLGRGDEAGSVDSSHPERVAALSHVASLDHTCAVDESGAAWCWGTGPFLLAEPTTVTTERTPVKLGLPHVQKIAVSFDRACAEVENGVRCWGSNADGQLGPFGTPGDSEIALPKGAPVRAMAVGRATFVLREDGSLLTWGATSVLGRLTSLFPDPYPDGIAVSGVFAMDLAHDNACATAGGVAYCWGARVTPSDASVDIDRALPERVARMSEPVVEIATTRTSIGDDGQVQRYRWCATTTAGKLFCWGANESGQAGDGKEKFAFEPVEVQGLPERVAQVKTTPHATCALLVNGKVRCWGSNSQGQLGNGANRGTSFVPVEVMLP